MANTLTMLLLLVPVLIVDS